MPVDVESVVLLVESPLAVRLSLSGESVADLRLVVAVEGLA